MLRVTVDLVPWGLEEAKRNLYTLEIANIGHEGVTVDEDGKEYFSYRVRSVDEYGVKIDHGTLIEGFDRTKPAYKLIGLIIEKLDRKGLFEKK